MSDYTRPESAAFAAKAGSSSQEAALAWFAYCFTPSCPSAREELASHLDLLLQQRLPDGYYATSLQGMEGDIRQKAHLLLIGRYLAGNAELLEATASGDLAEVANQLCKSVGGAVRAERDSLRKKLDRESEHIEQGSDPDSIPDLQNTHPANRRALWELPFEQQQLLVFAALEKAVIQNLVSGRSAGLAREMVSEGKSQSDVARCRGITRQSVHEALGPVREVIAELIEREEFPLS
jgi:hypothetical protein